MRATPDRIDTSRAALIVYDSCRRPLTPRSRTAMRPVLDAWVALIGACRVALPTIDNRPSHTSCFPNLDGYAAARQGPTPTTNFKE